MGLAVSDASGMRFALLMTIDVLQMRVLHQPLQLLLCHSDLAPRRIEFGFYYP